MNNRNDDHDLAARIILGKIRRIAFWNGFMVAAAIFSFIAGLIIIYLIYQ